MFENIINSINERPVYSIIIVYAMVTATAFYIITTRKKEFFRQRILVSGISITLSLIASLLFCRIISKLLTTEEVVYEMNASILYTLIAFTFIGYAFAYIFKVKDYMQGTVSTLLLFIAIARIGCVFEGCCGGILPFPAIESILCGVAFFVNFFLKKKIKYMPFFIIYVVYRFVVDFFKDSYLIERQGFFSVAQYVSVIALAGILLLSVNKGLGDKHEK